MKGTGKATKKKKKKGQDFAPRNERLETQGSSTRLQWQSHSFGSSPSAWPGEGGRRRGRGQRCHPRNALSSPSSSLTSPHPHCRRLIKVYRLPRRLPEAHLGGSRGCAGPGPPASYLWERCRSPATVRSSHRSGDKQLSMGTQEEQEILFFVKKGSKQPPPSPWGCGWGKGREPLLKKVSHFPADKPALRPAPSRRAALRARVLRPGASPLRPLQRLRLLTTHENSSPTDGRRLRLPSQTRARKMEEEEEEEAKEKNKNWISKC